MTDEMDLAALLITENARRTAILDQNVHEELDKVWGKGDMTNINAEDLAADLLAYSVDFQSSRWSYPENVEILQASCQRWLDARPSR